MKPILLGLFTLAACKGASDSGPVETDVDTDPDTDVETDTHADTDTDLPPTGNPIVVYFTTDTLGATAAAEFGWCAKMQETVGRYGLDVACLDGAVSPSSWTMASHARMLFPANHVGGGGEARQFPGCTQDGLLGAFRAANSGGFLTFGSDNRLLGTQMGGSCQNPYTGETTSPYAQGADTTYYETGNESQVAQQPPEDRAAYLALEDLLEATGEGKPAFAFLNAFEVGGHFPRCWSDPDNLACQDMFQLGVEHGVIAADADPQDVWLGSAFMSEMMGIAASEPQNVLSIWRPAFWGTMHESIASTHDELFTDRLEILLGGLQEQGRLADLTLVVLGDHGENPCVELPFDHRIQCWHTQMPTEYDANVPVFVTPASRAEAWHDAGYVGGAGQPWSTVNLAYALVPDFGGEVPASWPPMEPVGTATSWTCTQGGMGAYPEGVHIVGDVSLRCQGPQCGGFDWTVPTDAYHVDEMLSVVPDPVADWDTTPNRFETFCGL